MLLAGCAALAVEGYAALVHSGGGINDVLPAYLAVALLAGLALGSAQAWWAAAAGVLVLAQTALLLSGLHPAQAIPSAADRAVGERLVAGIRAFGGTVAVPADPGLSLLAGMAPAAHQDAAYDVLRATDQAAIASFQRSVAHALAARTVQRDHHRRPRAAARLPARARPVLPAVPAAAAGRGPGRRVRVPVAGRPAFVRPRPSVWLPRGERLTARHAVGVLDGAVEERPSSMRSRR